MGKIVKNGVTYSGSSDNADNVKYNNNVSNLDATNVQEAIDKLDESVDTLNGRLTQVQSQIVPTASIEIGDTASKAYNIGDFLVKNGVLYKVTKDIAKNDALTVGTNIAMTTVGGELSSIKSSSTDNRLDDASYVGSNAKDYFRLVKIGNIVFAIFQKIELTSPNGKITIKELPTEFIPKNEQMFSFYIDESGFIPTGIIKNDGYFYSRDSSQHTEISSSFFYFLD